MNYIEQDCTFIHEGKPFTYGGAIVTEKYVLCYMSNDGVATDWEGNAIGTYRITATWRTPNSFMSTTRHQAEVTINEVVYTGRTFGIGMVFHGKRKAGQAHAGPALVLADCVESRNLAQAKKALSEL